MEKYKNKYRRTLDLKFQLDKLENILVENIPLPSFNIFNKLELHANEYQLKSDNNQVK